MNTQKILFANFSFLGKIWLSVCRLSHKVLTISSNVAKINPKVAEKMPSILWLTLLVWTNDKQTFLRQHTGRDRFLLAIWHREISLLQRGVFLDK